MRIDSTSSAERTMTNIFERYLTVWVGLCILGGILLGNIAPGFAGALDGMAIHVNGAPVVSIPIAICLFLMMYPTMVKIDFTEVVKARGKKWFEEKFLHLLPPSPSSPFSPPWSCSSASRER